MTTETIGKSGERPYGDLDDQKVVDAVLDEFERDVTTGEVVAPYARTAHRYMALSAIAGTLVDQIDAVTSGTPPERPLHPKNDDDWQEDVWARPRDTVATAEAEGGLAEVIEFPTRNPELPLAA